MQKYVRNQKVDAECVCFRDSVVPLRIRLMACSYPLKIKEDSVGRGILPAVKVWAYQGFIGAYNELIFCA